jgi:hypothetical protein
MIGVVAKSFGYQLDSLVDYIQVNYRCESPESGFARYIFHQIGNPPPFRMACDAVIQSMEPRRLHEAPVLAAFGYELACGRVLDNTLLKAWANGLTRLANRDAFPSDRASFFFRPIELLGIALGASVCPIVRAEDLCWLQDILAQGEQKLTNSEFWTFLLSDYAAKILSVTWKPRSLPLLDNIAIDEYALVKWICACDSILAQRLGLHQIENEVERNLLYCSITTLILPHDVSRAAIVYLVLKTSIDRVFQNYWEQYNKLDLNIEEVINFINFICARMNTTAEQFQPSNFCGELYDDDSLQELLKLLPQLQSHVSNLQDNVSKAIRSKSKTQIINIPGGTITMNNNQNIEIQQNFSGSVNGVVGKVEGNQNIFVSEHQQTLSEAAQEIQQLLTQLEVSNPTASEIQKVDFLTMGIAHNSKVRFVNALNAGWKEAIREMLDNKFLNVAIAALEGWKTPLG